MSTFIKIIADILNDEPSIAQFPKDALISLDPESATVLLKPIPIGICKRIARLQTLCVLEQDRGFTDGPPEAAQNAGVNRAEAMAQALSVQEDSAERIAMLERLIVEQVRAVVPTECERFNVRYALRKDLSVVYFPNFQHKFRD